MHGETQSALRRSRKCTSCGACAEKCPVKVPNEYNFGHDMRKAIYKDYPQGIPSVYTIDTNIVESSREKVRCLRKVCPAGAIDYEQKECYRGTRSRRSNYAPGYELFDTSRVSEYGHGIAPMW